MIGQFEVKPQKKSVAALDEKILHGGHRGQMQRLVPL